MGHWPAGSAPRSKGTATPATPAEGRGPPQPDSENARLAAVEGRVEIPHTGGTVTGPGVTVLLVAGQVRHWQPDEAGRSALQDSGPGHWQVRLT